MNIVLKRKNKIEFTKLDVLMLLYFITFGVRMLTDISFNIMTALWFVVGIVIFVCAYAIYPRYRKPLLTLFVVDMIALVGLYMTGGHNPMNAFILVSTQALGILIYERRKNLGILEVVTLFMVFYLAYEVVTTPKVLINSWQYGIVLSKLVLQNTVSILLILFLSLHFIRCHENQKNVNYVYFFVAFVTAVICDGMGGILTLALYLGGIWLVNHKANKLRTGRLFFAVGVFVLAVTAINGWGILIEKLTDDNARFYIWSNYFWCIDSIEEFLFGADVSRVEFLARARNMHNTFINWHYNYGIIPTLFFLYMMVQNVVYSIKTKNFVFLLILGVTGVRAMTDETGYCFMVLWTYMWIYAKEHTCRMCSENNTEKG